MKGHRLLCLSIIASALTSIARAQEAEELSSMEAIKPKNDGSEKVDVADEGQVVEEEGEEEEDDGEQELYFYLPDPTLPVIEYEPPQLENEHDLPDFIYNPKPGMIRIVEFYAHWCPHCQHYRHHYIEFAYQLQTAAEKYNLNIGTFAVSCVPHHSVCKNQNITAFPRIKVFPAGSSEGSFMNSYELQVLTILRVLGLEMEMDIDEEVVEKEDNHGKHHPVRGQVVKNAYNNKQEQPNDENEEFFLTRTKKDIYNDAYLSFDFAMQHGVFVGRGPLSNTTKAVFADFIRLLMSSMPPTFALQNMLNDIAMNMERALEREENLVEIVRRHPPKKKTWSRSCTRGDPMAGYTCGLWELFHIMTVGVVEWNSMVVGDDWSYYRPEESSKMLRNFIEHFFGCEVCRLNFLHAYDACAYDRCNRLNHHVGDTEDWIELPLWLFETHNGVNVRLMKERAEREKRSGPVTRDDEMSVQWPSRKACPMCWHGDGRWDRDKVYMFLRLTYWPEDDTSKEYRRMLYGSDEPEDKFVVDEEGTRVKWVILSCLVWSVTFSGATLYQKRLRIARTGRHKKDDGPTPCEFVDP